VSCLHAAFTVDHKYFYFLIDTGASVSIFPFKFAKSLPISPTFVCLKSVNGRPVTVHGECSLSISSTDLRRSFRWCFVVADVTQPIIGADFLTAHQLSVSCSSRHLTDEVTGFRTVCKSATTSTQSPILSVPSTNQPVAKLLFEYSNLMQPMQVGEGQPSSDVAHVIDTGNSRPVFAKPRPLRPDLYQAAKKEFEKLLACGIIRPSKSPWSSPLHMVRKENGQWRPCGDYRALNSITVPDRYPVPHIQHLLQRFSGAAVFSKIDLVKAYHQIPVAPDDVKKTAITTPFGLFEYIRMPFGLRNASQSFQRYMDMVFRDIPFVAVYVDDVLVASDNTSQHEQHLRVVLERLHQHNLKISSEKCIFSVPEVSFLGCSLSSSGIRPSTNRTDAISTFPVPDTYSAMRRFLGMVGYYRRFIPNFANIACPIQDLLTFYTHQPKKFSITSAAKDAFNQLKEKLINCISLSPISNQSSTFHLVTDASSVAVGAALHQKVGYFRPVAFFSKKLTGAQKSYSTYDRELLAVYLAVLHFKPLIQAQLVTVVTDHKPLVAAFRSQSPSKSDRQQRHWSFISEYITDIIHVRGSDNVVADALSRTVSSVSIDPTDLQSIAEHQVKDTETQTHKEKLKEYPLTSGTILCDNSTRFPRPFLPQCLRKTMFNTLHSLSHPGIKATVNLISTRYMWPGLERDVKQWCRECLFCQQSKIGRHTKSKLQAFNLPVSNRFEVVHMDIVGPLPPCQLKNSNFIGRYIVTFIDRTTRWCEAQPVTDITAETIASSFISQWVSRFGVPLYLVTDRGRQFESEIFNCLSKLIGFHRLRTTAYHPQSNGMIERMHRTLKTSLKARGGEWLQQLPIVLLGIRAIPNESGVSPFTAVTGQQLLLPAIQKTKITDAEYIKELSRAMKEVDFLSLSEGRIHGPKKEYISSQLKTASHIWLRIDRIVKPLEAPYTGPYRVLESDGKVVRIEKADGTHETVSIDRVKPAVLGRSSQSRPSDKSVQQLPQTCSPSQTQRPGRSPTRAGRVVKPPRKIVRFRC